MAKVAGMGYIPRDFSIKADLLILASSEIFPCPKERRFKSGFNIERNTMVLTIIIFVALGLGLLWWGMSAGLLASKPNKAEIFSGPFGFIVNITVIAIGVGILALVIF